jgi:hypothetical protein
VGDVGSCLDDGRLRGSNHIPVMSLSKNQCKKQSPFHAIEMNLGMVYTLAKLFRYQAALISHRKVRWMTCHTFPTFYDSLMRKFSQMHPKCGKDALAFHR